MESVAVETGRSIREMETAVGEIIGRVVGAERAREELAGLGDLWMVDLALRLARGEGYVFVSPPSHVREAVRVLSGRQGQAFVENAAAELSSTAAVVANFCQMS
jgi:hypothetical protein